MATDKIALTSSMRSNLLSLKNTQKLLDTTQDRLSTGYKVNSAMDNPSSYFTAQSLNSRADDLSTLLDSIGQAISTLEVADKGITTLQDFVEQAKSIANSARDTANVASKATSDNVTFNSATAKTDKLTDVMANVQAGDKFTIRLGDATKMEASSNVSKDQTLEQIGIKANAKIEMIVGNKMYEFTFGAAGTTAEAAAPDASGVVKQTIGIDETLEDFMSEVVYTVGRKVLNAEVKEGKLSFNTMDNSSLVIRSTAYFETGKTETGKTLEVDGKVFADGKSDDTSVSGAKVSVGSTDIEINAFIDPATGKIANVDGLVEEINSKLTADSSTVVARKSIDGKSVEFYDKAAPETAPTVTFTKGTGTGGSTGSTNTANAAVTDDIVLKTNFNKVFGFDEGYTVTITDGMTVEQFRQAIDGLEGVSADFDSKGHMVISGEQGDDMVLADVSGEDNNVVKSLLGSDIYSATNGSNERAKYAKQFDAVLDQINQLVQDTSYKGINLLNGDDLTVVFNETRTSTLELKGVTFNSTGLGFTTSEAEWKDNASIDKSLDQITKATSLLRAQASEFGQNLSTVQIREDFTENMINNLQTGADKLTLADMNEEAANMLALQTRQQLGVNSLSMASQASQSVLQLF